MHARLWRKGCITYSYWPIQFCVQKMPLNWVRYFVNSVARYQNNQAFGWQKNSVQLFSIKALDFFSFSILEALVVALMPHRSLLRSGSDERDSKSSKNPWKSWAVCVSFSTKIWSLRMYWTSACIHFDPKRPSRSVLSQFALSCKWVVWTSIFFHSFHERSHNATHNTPRP